MRNLLNLSFRSSKFAAQNSSRRIPKARTAMASKATERMTDEQASATISPNQKKGLWNVLDIGNKTFAFLSAAGAAFAVIAAIFSFVLGTPDLMLTVWSRETSPVYPSQSTGGLELPLEIGGQAIHTADIVSMQISNSGKGAIGSANATWTLSLTSQEGSQLRVIGPPSSTPSNGLIAGTSVTQNKADLNLRFFQPRATVALRLLVLNAKAPKVRAALTLTGIPLDETFLSPEERRRDRLAVPFLFLFLIVLIVAAFFERRSKDRKKEPKPSIWAYMVWIPMGSVIFTLLSASGIAWLLKWFNY
jgi:hypothetical protein